MITLPSDIANQALDAAGIEFTIGDLTEGTRPAQVLLRAYGQCLRQLLRAANWDWSRKTAPMVLLGDATGQTANVGSLVPIPWRFSYQYPIDCLKARFVPWNQASQFPAEPSGNITTPTVPGMTGIAQTSYVRQRIVPARFTIATDYNYPPQQGQDSVPGVSQAGRTVVLTNVQSAQLVYTALMLDPAVWDSLFRAALVAYIASEIALALNKDKRLGLALRRDQIAIAKQKLMEARIVDGNEGVYSSDIKVDWLNARRSGGYGGWQGNIAGDGPGVWGYGYESCGFADGSAY